MLSGERAAATTQQPPAASSLTWTRQPVPMISEHSAHLAPLSVDFRTWLWRYTYLLLLISMLWHRQAIFKSKGDKLCSSAESRIWTRGPRHQFASRLNARWQTDWAIEDQAETWTRQPVPMIIEHSAHLAPLSVDFRTWLWRYTCLLLLISMLWYRQAIFKSKGDKLCSSAESRIWTRGPRHQFASRLNARWQTDWAIEDQAETWTRQPVPKISEHLAHLAPLSVDFRTWLWRYTCFLLLISMLWPRQATLKAKGDKLCSSAESRIWTRGPRHQFASRLNARWQTDWAIEDQAETWTRQPVPMISEHSAHFALLSVDFRTWLWRYTCFFLLISMLWHRQAIFKSKGNKLCSSAESRIWTRGPRHQFASRLNARWQTDWAIKDQAETWTRQPVPMISEHSAHLTPLSVDFRTWLWRYTCFLLLISMLWHRQAIFKSKGDKLCSSAESRIWTRGPRHQFASRLNARWQTDWAIEDQAETWTRQPGPMISQHSAHLAPLSVDFRTWLWRYTCLLLLISMLWHMQAIFRSKGDMLCSSAESRIWTRGPRHQFASKLNARWQTDWANEDQAETWTWQPVPMISEHSAHLAPLSVDFRTWLWRYTCLLLLISMLWHRQTIFKSKGDMLCSSAESRIWTRGPRHQFASKLNARWQTDWAIEDQAETWTRQPGPMISEHSAHLAPLSVDFRTWLWRYTCFLLLISMLWHRQAIFKSKVNKLCSSAESRIWTRGPKHQFASRLNARWQTDWAIEDQAETWTRQPVPMIREHSAQLAPLSVDFRTWLWRYTCLCCYFRCSGTGKRYSNRKETSCVPLLKAGFEPGAPDTNSPADWMLADKPTELSRIKQKLELDSPSLWSASIQPTWPTVSWFSHLALAIYMFVVVNFDALAQASDIQIERRQVVFLCWKQDLNPGPQTPIRQQTECSFIDPCMIYLCISPE